MFRTIGIFLLLPCLFFPVLCRAAEKDLTGEEELLYLGEKAFSEQVYEIAREKLEQFAKSYPDSQHMSRVRSLLARTYYHFRRYEEAGRIFESLLDELTNARAKADCLFWLGRSLLRQRKFDDGARTFDSLIRDYPENPLVPYAKTDRAVCLFEKGDADGAMELLDAVISEFANKDEGANAQLEKCGLLLAAGEHAKARDGLLLLVDRKMSKELQSRLFFLLGETWFYDNDLEKAVAQYKKSLETGTYYDWYPEASYAIAWCRLKQGDHGEAMQIFTALAKDHKATRLGWKSELGVARALLLQEKNDESIEKLDGVLSNATEAAISAEAEYLLGNAALAKKEYEDAVKHYNTMIETYPGSEFVADAYFGKATVLYIRKEYRESLTGFSKVLEHAKRPELRLAAQLRKGDAHYEIKEYVKALNLYETARKELSNIEEPERVLLQIGWCHYKLEDYDEAVMAFNDLLKDYGASGLADDATYGLGGCYYRRGEFAKAVEKYKELKKNFEKSPLLDRASYQIGACHYHLEEYDLAEGAYREVVENHPKSKLADRADYEIGWCRFYRSDNAMEHFKSYIKKRPTSPFTPEVLFWIGEQYYHRGDFDEASKRFSDLKAKHPKSPLADEALYWSGRSMRELGKIEEALEKFDALPTEFPDSEFAIDSAYRAAVCRLDLGKTEDGLQALLKLRDAPDSRYLENEMRLKIAEGYLELKKLGEAFDEYKKLSESGSRKFRAWGLYGMGLSYKAQNFYTKAISSFMDVTWRHSDQREVVSLSYLEAGECYAILNKKREAIDRYVVIIEEKLPHADEAKKRIRELKRIYTFD